MSELTGAEDGAEDGAEGSAGGGAEGGAENGSEGGAEGGAEHPGLGRHRRTYRPRRRKPSAYALLLLKLTPFSALTYLLTILLGVFLGWAGSVAAVVAEALGGLALLGPFAVRTLWYRRHTEVEFRLYEKGLVAIAADAAEAVYPWQSAAVFTNGSHRYKLSNPEGTVVTLGAADRGPVLGGERIRGLRTRTVIRGAQLPQEEEWGPAIRQGVRDAQLAPAAVTVLGGGEVSFGDLVLSRDGLTVRRRRGQDDFTAWEDVDALSLTAEGCLLIASRGSDFPTRFVWPAYRIPNLEIFLDLARQLRESRPRAARAPDAPSSDAPAPDAPSSDAPAPDAPSSDAPAPDEPAPDAPAPDEPAPDAPSSDAPAPDAPTPARPASAARDDGESPEGEGSPDDEASPDDVPELLGLYVTFGVGAWAAWRLGTRQGIDGLGSALLAAVRVVLGGFLGAVFGLLLAAAVMIVPKVAGLLLVEPLIRWIRHRRYVAAAALALLSVVPPVVLLLFLFRTVPARLVPLVALLFFGGWTLLLLVKRCGASERLVVRHLPDLPGVFLVVLAVEQLVSGDVLTLTPAAGFFFPLAIGLSWRGWRKLKESTRPTVQAVADIVLSVELGLVLTVLMVWLANVLSFTPSQVTVVRDVVERIQELTEVDWLYWLAAYTVLASGSYALLRWPDRVARVRQRLRPVRFGESRLPLGITVNFARRSLSGVSVGIMVALLFPVALVPVSESAWKRPVAERYALEVQRGQYAEGAAARVRGDPPAGRGTSPGRRPSEGRDSRRAPGRSFATRRAREPDGAGHSPAGRPFPDRRSRSRRPGTTTRPESRGRRPRRPARSARREPTAHRGAGGEDRPVRRAGLPRDHPLLRRPRPGRQPGRTAPQGVPRRTGGGRPGEEDLPPVRRGNRPAPARRRPPRARRRPPPDGGGLRPHPGGGRTRRRRPARLLRPVRHRHPHRGHVADARDRPGEPAPVSAAGHRPLHRLRQLHDQRFRHGRRGRPALSRGGPPRAPCPVSRTPRTGCAEDGRPRAPGGEPRAEGDGEAGGGAAVVV
ncbi:hypothetical protein [Streptomyces sp. TE33382]